MKYNNINLPNDFDEKGSFIQKNETLPSPVKERSSLGIRRTEQPPLHSFCKNIQKHRFNKTPLFSLNPNLSNEPLNSNNFEKIGENKNKEPRKYYTSYSKLSEIKLLTIGIASPLRILQWAEKTLPNGKIYGEVLNANTLHHKTFKPQKGGLFCERIFGPVKDFECACGKIDKSVKKLHNEAKNLAKNAQLNAQLNEKFNDQDTNLSTESQK